MRIMSVIGFDLAVETILKAIVTSADPQKNVSDEFNGVLQQVEVLMTANDLGVVPDRGNIIRVHSIRNDALHKAKYPNEDDVVESRVYVRDFLDKITSLVWSVEFAEVSLASLIADETARGFLLEAEAQLAKGDFNSAAEFANAGLTWTLGQARSTLYPSSWQRLREPMGLVRWNIGPQPRPEGDVDPLIWRILEAQDKEAMQRFDAQTEQIDSLRDDVRGEFQRLEEPLLFAMLGTNYSAHLQFRAIAGFVRFHGKEPQFKVTGASTEISRDDAEFVVAYCSNTSAQVESFMTQVIRSD